jgi:3-hydroxyisobutyrate dehydrogenase-like beta-hydroxyacid dehydrogenase
MKNQLTIGFIGFGEAGFTLAMGLRNAGVEQICAYDINAETVELGKKIRQRAAETETRLLDSPADLAGATNLILSTVTADAAAQAATQIAAYLDAHHVYVDLNSVSPSLKQKISEIVSQRGARFVEAAIMAAVKPHGHRVPILLGGVHASTLVDLLAPLGMRFEVVSAKVGAAAAVKMCRSIVVKGLEALLFECTLAARRYDADERVFASLNESLPGQDWTKLAGYMMSRVLEHGERRAREMEEVAETLRVAGVEPIMALATARRQELGARLNHFTGKVPENYGEVVQMLAGN